MNFKYEDEISLLHIAVQMSNERITELLIDHNALVDARNSDELTPLHFAAENGKKLSPFHHSKFMQ